MRVKVKKKVKWSRYRPGVAQRVGRAVFHDRGTRRGWVVSSNVPPGKTRYPFYRRLGGPNGRSGRAENLPPPRDSIPDRPARISRYTDWAIGPTLYAFTLRLYSLNSHYLNGESSFELPVLLFHAKDISLSQTVTLAVWIYLVSKKVNERHVCRHLS